MYIRTQKVKRFLCCISVILLLFTLFSGCGAKATDKKRAAEIAAKVLTCTAEQRSGSFVTILNLASVSGAGILGIDSFAEPLRTEYGDYLTDKCIEKMAENRCFLFGNSDLENIDGDITPKEIKLTKSSSSENAFDYTAKLYTGDTCAATACGTIVLSADDTAKADSFTVKIEK